MCVAMTIEDTIQEHAPFLNEIDCSRTPEIFFTDRAVVAERTLYGLAETSDAGVSACLKEIPADKLFGTLVEKALFRFAARRLCEKMLPYNMSLIGDKDISPLEDTSPSSGAKAAEANLRVALRVDDSVAQKIKDGLSAEQKASAPELMKEVDLVSAGKPLEPEVKAQPLLGYRRSLSFPQV